ncbi:MAG: zf-HC2 domain-containing protein, partial [Planctomycetes bacterium]|nr:zf-HC2 domain-containing protein [Planctomycetota bacterium]
CLAQQAVEALVGGTLPTRRTAAIERHLVKCERCRTSLAEARENEEYLARVRDAEELGRLGRDIAHRAAPQTTVAGDLPSAPPAR